METRDVISLISKIREKVNRFIVAELAENGLEGIGTSHGDIIYALLRTPRLTMAEISQRIHKDKSTVTALVDKLVRLGYVVKERDQVDARVVYVALTGKGRELESLFEAVSQDMLNVFYRNVSEQEQQELLRILEKIHRNF
ncbi:MarR family winged helix-turn-helix transcriptional regulator [Paenibacillus tepidiphilus]|uniref:MarR family winged helix-turn-helix transcriptional regulator n=1 Tax=Paenibacillus tepidiphilus TaxID=2608683 RepID=UPI00123AB81B|nr:MarR family winged helix-turn-helix transcriptional regulator [Paenibacillus tepidiphilus]